jgi:hypothetical protein
VSRQTIVVLGIGAVVGVAALVGLNRDVGDAEPVPASVRIPPAEGSSAPAPSAPELPVTPPTRRPASRASAPATSVSPPEPTVPEVPTTATLHITSDVPDAQVFIDRKFIGTAPVTADDVAPGSHQINVSAPGYDGVAETVDVIAGPREIVISLKTIRLNESIAVKHKHRFGSCAGQLVATPEGIRYETDNTKDGFSVPLAGIENFTVDFVGKKLTVKVKGGRSYDFTDPDDKADPLYFFHQAVEKVRARLTKGPRTAPTREDR